MTKYSVLPCPNKRVGIIFGMDVKGKLQKALGCFSYARCGYIN